MPVLHASWKTTCPRCHNTYGPPFDTADEATDFETTYPACADCQEPI